MAENQLVQETDSAEVIIAKAKDFWARNSKVISIVFVVVVLGVAGYFVYDNYYKKPQEEKAIDLMFKAEEYYRLDSFSLALNGDGANYGFKKIIDKYGSTDAGNLACLYAGICYIKTDDNANAIKYLKKFSTDSKPVKARVYKLLGDASAETGKNADAVDYYKKAAFAFEEDVASSAQALYLAAYLSDKVINNPKQAIELYKQVKEKFPRTAQASDAENHLAQLGVYNVTE